MSETLAATRMEGKVVLRLRRGKKDTLCLLPATLRGFPVHFMIDTGAYHSFVGLDVLHRLGLQHAVDPNHPVMATVGRRREDRHEGGTTLKLEVARGFTAEHDFCISGAGRNILGSDFLRNYDGVLQFSEQDDLLVLSTRRRQLEVGEQFRVYAPCQVFGRTVQAQLDSGANTTTLQRDVVPTSAIMEGVLRTAKVKVIGGVQTQTVCHLQPQQAEVAGRRVTLRYPTVFFKDADNLTILDVNFLRQNYIRLHCRKRKIKFRKEKFLKLKRLQ
uniref:Peptidase A2 domain-containing protein n=1 Tax=Scylla olivacea TaxID=85551 RepID=A0A0P4W4T6_SCYOL